MVDVGGFPSAVSEMGSGWFVGSYFSEVVGLIIAREACVGPDFNEVSVCSRDGPGGHEFTNGL